MYEVRRHAEKARLPKWVLVRFTTAARALVRI